MWGPQFNFLCVDLQAATIDDQILLFDSYPIRILFVSIEHCDSRNTIGNQLGLYERGSRKIQQNVAPGRDLATGNRMSLPPI